MQTTEVNFDALVGPTHHYAGLAAGNFASIANAHRVSNPRAAAIEGLKKMRLLMHLGIPQAVLPPQERPCIKLLENLGFVGSSDEILKKAYQEVPAIFSAVYSASSMWLANAATVTPSVDSPDGRIHITPANLITNLHRAIETAQTIQLFEKIFSNTKHFKLHAPLFGHEALSDEGAANHNRLCNQYGEQGFHVFVYGRNNISGQPKHTDSLRNMPIRQSLEASRAIARLHQLSSDRVLFLQQNPAVISQGVFHNDVISVANQNVFLYHELAFQESDRLLSFCKQSTLKPLHMISVSLAELSIEDAVQSYLFNSQLVTLPDAQMALIAPIECQENVAAHRVLSDILEADNPISQLHFVDCRQSMRNGGGPACLGLRMVLSEAERAACQAVFLTEDLYQDLLQWIEHYYRDRLEIEDLWDPLFLAENRRALEILDKILQNKKAMS